MPRLPYTPLFPKTPFYRRLFADIPNTRYPPLPTYFPFPTNPTFPNCKAHKNGHTYGSSETLIPHFIFLSLRYPPPTQPHKSETSFFHVTFPPYDLCRKTGVSISTYGQPHQCHLFPCWNNLPMKPLQGPYTPRQTARNDGTAPGRGRSAPDVEDDRLPP